MLTMAGLYLAAVLGQAEAPALDEKQVAARLEPFFRQQAERYGFALDAEGRQSLAISDQPVMKWTAEGNSGGVWVWTRDGRPEVVGCLGAFVNGAGKLEAFHEFHSLTLKPLPPIAIGGGRYTWESDRPGVTPKLIEGAPEPAATDKLRLLQMRNLAREFAAGMKSGPQTHQLRLTPTPLFRYPGSHAEVSDGALFSYLWDNGTDPEMILMIETRMTPEGPQWHYAPVRFTWREVWLSRGDREIWRAPEHNESRTSRVLHDHYVTVAAGEIDLAALPEPKTPAAR